MNSIRFAMKTLSLCKNENPVYFLNGETGRPVAVLSNCAGWRYPNLLTQLSELQNTATGLLSEHQLPAKISGSEVPDQDISEDLSCKWALGNGNFGYFSRLENISSNPAPVSALCFDPYEEVIWSGYCNGRVVSHTAPTFERFTGFVASFDEIRAIEVTETCVLSLSANHIKGNTRHGLGILNHTSSNFQNLSSLYRVPNSSTVILGGEQKKLIVFDYERIKEVRAITVRSINNLESIRVIPKPHGGSITDFDVFGNKIITCGCSYRQNSLHYDPYVKIYDLRTGQALPPLPLSFSPIFARFLPSFCDSRVAIVSQMGQVQVTDLNERGAGLQVIVECDGYQLSSFESSSTSEFLAFGDMIGNIHIYADRTRPAVNESSWDTEFADPSLGTPQSFTIDDMSTSLASVPMPFPTEDPLLSDWPPELCEPVIRKPKQAEPDMSAVLKTIQFVSYAVNTRANTAFRYFNICPYLLDYSMENEVKIIDKRPVVVPQFYRKMQTKRRSGHDEPYVLKLNKSRHVPLQACHNFPNVTSIVRMLYTVVGLRNVFLCHLCDEEHCIVCQLGFLFRMLSDKATNKSVASTNLGRSLTACGAPNNIREVMRNHHELMTFVMDRIEKDFTEEQLKSVLEMLGSHLLVNSRCIRCETICQSEETRLYLTLQYPTASERLTLGSLIEKALHTRGQREEECSSCKTKTRKEDGYKVGRLPPIMLIDTNPTSEKYFKYWNDQLNLSELRPPYVHPEEIELDGSRLERPCRYGTDCRFRPHCKYSHGVGDWDAEVTTWLEDTGGRWKHFVADRLFAKVSNGVTIISLQQEYEEESEEYELVSMVAGVAEQPTAETGEVHWSHTVSVIKELKTSEGNDDQEEMWAVTNETLVTRVHKNEALHLDARWKLPLMLCYVKKSSQLLNVTESRVEIDSNVFLIDANLTGNDDVAKERRAFEIPGKGDMVGIDAEFINVGKERNHKSVGRVSCVNSSGQKVLIDDYVITCDGDVVDDYLTQYSGILEEDLNPLTSTKHLTTLKRVYLKILHLVERGVIFVGHALNNDFSVLNIYVPPEQMIDTVHLFHIKQQRMLSLQFLAWHLLGEKIQEGWHDSVEDARVALKLYDKWKVVSADGTLGSVVQQVYEKGKASGWRVSESPAKSLGSASPAKSRSPTSDKESRTSQ